MGLGQPRPSSTGTLSHIVPLYTASSSAAALSVGWDSMLSKAGMQGRKD